MKRSKSFSYLGFICSLMWSFPDSYPFTQPKIETRPQISSLSPSLQSSFPPPPLPSKAKAQGNKPGDKLNFPKASPDISATSHLFRKWDGGSEYAGGTNSVHWNVLHVNCWVSGEGHKYIGWRKIWFLWAHLIKTDSRQTLCAKRLHIICHCELKKKCACV